MARCVANNGRVILGGIQIKKIQALVWWVRDCQKLGQPIDAALWTSAAMTNAGIDKRIEKYQPKADMKAAYLKAFNPDDFETHKDALRNLLSQTKSVTRKCSLLYIVSPEVAPVIFTDDFEERMFQMPLIRQEYSLDNRTLYSKLKAFLIGSAGYAWIERSNHAANGRTSFQAWVDHYNGAGEFKKHTYLAKVMMRELNYKNEQSTPFEKYTEIIIKCFSTLDKDEYEMLSDQQKVNSIINGIRVQDVQLMEATLYIAGKYPRDMTMACTYFSREVARIHGSAQVAGQTSCRKCRQIYSADSSGCGQGCFGNRGRGSGRGRGYGRSNGRVRGGIGWSNRDNRGMSDFNGIDISNPTRAFTDKEWTALSQGGG